MKASDKIKLTERIRSIEGLTDEERSVLLGLINETKTYGLVWEDKPEDVVERLCEELPVLVEVPPKALTNGGKDSPNHILIEGDNLEVLATLAFTHAGKVDVIYIDPPYNTGNKDFIYNDSYVDTDDSYRHSKWLSFMSKRLRIAKKLLSDRGVIFISIDDNEQANLRLLCDEVFGWNNYVTTLHVEMSATQGMKVRAAQMGTIVKNGEYIIIYAANGRKQIAQTILYDYRQEFDDHYNIYYKDGKLLKLKDVFAQEYPDLQVTDLTSLYYSSEQFRNFVVANLDYIFADDKIGPVDAEINPGEVIKLSKNGKEYLVFHNGKKLRQLLPLKNSFGQCDDFDNSFGLRKIRGDWWKDFYKDMGNVTKEGNVIFENGKKPLRLIRQIIKMSSDLNSVILDFFAGSGTTLHAVMQLNAQDGGKRQCILCTNNEKGICENVTYERNKRVIEGYTKLNGDHVDGLTDNNLRYYRIGFVGRSHSTKNMRRLAVLSTAMLCIKENLYTEKKTFANLPTFKNIYRYFEQGDLKMLVIYDERYVDEIVKMISRVGTTTPIKVYVFSPSEDPWEASFEPVSDKVELCALPQAIYNTYKRILPKRKSKTIDAVQEDVLSTSEVENRYGEFVVTEGGEA